MLRRKDNRMDSTITNVVNLVFISLIAALSIVGYVLTIKRIGQRWPLWIILATGWALLAIPYALLLAGISIGIPVMTTIWLSSYLLIMVSLLLIFLKVVEIMKLRGKS
jgi:hypothetical protein